ncbi:MAG: D-alanyl-D-alanine carboxypeptidase family protein [Gaiellaceae bacterium]
MAWRWVVAAVLGALVAGSGASGAPQANGPKIKAPAAIVIDADTGRALWSKREHMRRPIASTTKIMTALVTMEHLRPNEIVVVTRKAARVPYGEGLKAGERVPVWKLYYGLLLASANDTAVALAEAAGGTRERFLKLMNKKARALGLRHTRYRSASGLIDEGNYSTVHDLAMLTRYALGVPRFREIVATKFKRVWWKPPTHAKLYENHNKLLWRYAGADGVKTGWTRAAGPCLVASATRNGIQLITVVLDSPDHYGDTTRLLDYGFRHRG